jgi:hypothetical protein
MSGLSLRYSLLAACLLESRLHSNRESGSV